MVPTHVWKAVYVPGQGAGAWIASNQESSEWQVVSIDALMQFVGIDPFPSLSAEQKQQVPAFPIFGKAVGEE
jgi:endonuclease G